MIRQAIRPAIRSAIRKPVQQQFGAYTDVTAAVNVLASTVVKGQLEASLFGNKVTNLLGDDGNCESTAGWIVGSGRSLTVDSANKVFGSNSIKIHCTGGYIGGAEGMSKSINFAPGHKYLYCGYGKLTAIQANDNFRLRIGSTYFDTFTSTSFSRAGGIYTSSDGVQTVSVVMYNTNATLPPDVYIDGLLLVDLTALYGTGNEPATVTEAMAKLNFINGTKSTSPQRVRSVGVNLFPPLSANNYEFLGSAGNTVTYFEDLNKVIIVDNSGWGAPYIKSKKYTPIIPGQTYYISHQYATGGNNVIYLYDESKNTIENASISGWAWNTYYKGYTKVSSGSIAIPINAKYIKTGYGGGTTKEKPMFEPGSTATTYEPHKSTEAYTTTTLRKVGSVSDEININDGFYTKRVSAVDNLGQCNWVLDSINAGTNVNSLRFRTDGYFPFSGIAGTYSNPFVFNIDCVIDNTVYPSKSADYLWANDAIGIGSYGDGRTSIRIAKSTLTNAGFTADANGIKNYLQSGVSIHLLYQFATPITQYTIPKELICYPSGSIIVEPFISDVGLYSTNIAIDDVNYPIRNMDFINKINVVNGTFIPVDLSIVTIASDGLSFTVTGAVNGEYYEYGYSYASELSTVGTLRYRTPAGLTLPVTLDPVNLAEPFVLGGVHYL